MVHRRSHPWNGMELTVRGVAGAGLRLGEGSPGDFVAGTLRVPKLPHSESAGYEEWASPKAAPAPATRVTLKRLLTIFVLFLGATNLTEAAQPKNGPQPVVNLA